MNVERPSGGRHLVTADRGFATGGGLAAQLLVRPLVRHVLKAIDAGLATGAIHATLPDGTRLVLGGRAPGFAPIVRLHSWQALVRLATSGSVGWYKAWELGEWSSPDPVPLFALFMANARTLGGSARAKGLWRVVNRALHLVRRNDPAGARRNIAAHYDLGNAFYGAWLDRTMSYSSAVFAHPAQSLEEAQAHKMRLLLRRLDLKPGQHLLEIGCGWGSLAELAAREFGVRVTGITLSAEQKAYADARIAAARLDRQVEVRLCDYREVDGCFDAIASVEMVEAVGRTYWPAFVEVIAARLKPGGAAALQLISIDDAIFEAYAASADFIQTYVFPGGMLVGEGEFRGLAEGAGLLWDAREGYGPHYAETLRRWRERFDEAAREERLPAEFGRDFQRLWRYYLMYCEGGFRGGGIDVAQVVLRSVS